MTTKMDRKVAAEDITMMSRVRDPSRRRWRRSLSQTLSKMPSAMQSPLVATRILSAQFVARSRAHTMASPPIFAPRLRAFLTRSSSKHSISLRRSS